MLIRKFIFIVLFLSNRSIAQVVPSQNDTLNYRVIGFNAQIPPKHRNCRLEIAKGEYFDTSLFKQYIIRSVAVHTNKQIIEVPSFGSSYTWRIVNPSDRTDSLQYKFHHFYVGYVPEIDTAIFRVKAQSNIKKNNYPYFFIDATKALYDAYGNPVWYLPTLEARGNTVRDLKITSRGTITFVIDEYGVFEVNYKGTVLWQGPNNGIISGDNLEHYHHEFTRLNNGNYMALAQDFQYIDPSQKDSAIALLSKQKIKNRDNSLLFERFPTGTLIEYDSLGKIVWSWKASEHLNGSKIFLRNEKEYVSQMRAHENSFFFDTGNKVVYLSMRNLNTILMINYPTGNIIDIYNGDTPKLKETTPLLFCGQHSCKVSADRQLYFYNNNSCNPGRRPQIIFLRRNKQMATPEISWKFDCPVDTLSPAYPSGGNVEELPDKSIFTSMAFPDSKMFIVTRNKKIIWSARLQTKNFFTKKWEPVNIYRASVVTKTRVADQLVWMSTDNH